MRAENQGGEKQAIDLEWPNVPYHTVLYRDQLKYTEEWLKMWVQARAMARVRG